MSNSTTTITRRFARITGRDVTAERVEAYLPRRYSVLSEIDMLGAQPVVQVTITGYDNAGWTLDDFVLPRLASGNMFGTEILEEDLSGPELEAERLRRAKAYAAYVVQCSLEELDAHSLPMWSVHGEPEGPLG